MKLAIAKEILKGGKGDDMPDKCFDKKNLKKGMKHESEHTKKKAVEKEIAKDHLAEDPEYYKKLEKIEKKAFATGLKTASELSMKVPKHETKAKKKMREAEEIASVGG